MIEGIIEWSIRNRYLVILASLVLGAAGFRAMMTMPVMNIGFRPYRSESLPQNGTLIVLVRR